MEGGAITTCNHLKERPSGPRPLQASENLPRTDFAHKRVLMLSKEPIGLIQLRKLKIVTHFFYIHIKISLG